MSHRTGNRLISAALGFSAAVLVLSSARMAAAQGATNDPRWQPWIGCWESADASGVRIIGSPTAPLVCAVPASGKSAVDVMTVISGKVVDHMLIDANREHRASTQDGCTGWESAAWSKSGSRLYVQSEYTCAGGLTRKSNGILALSPEGEWLDVKSVTSGTNKGVRVVRMREAIDLSAAPAEISSALQGRTLSLSTARMAAAASLTGADLLDASMNVDAATVEAWLVERNQGFTLDAKMLTALADAGLPDGVIDVMVGLTYPKVFALNPATREAEYRSDAATASGTTRIAVPRVLGYDWMGYPVIGYGSYGYGYGSYGSYYGQCASPYYGYGYYPTSFSSYGCAMNGYYGYGYGGSGYGYGYGYGYGNSGPIVIVVRGGDNGVAGDQPRVVKGKGYTQGSSGSSSSSSGSGSSGSGSSGSSSSGSGSSGSSSSGSGSTAPPRTAQPKKP